MSTEQAISAFTDFMSSGRFDGFTTSLHSLAILSGLVIPPLFVFAMLRGITTRSIRIFAVYVLVLTLLGTAVVGMWHFFVAIPFGMIGIMAYLNLARSPGAKRGKTASILLVVGIVEFHIMGLLATEPGNTWGAGAAPFAVGFCAQALSLVVLALFRLGWHGAFSSSVLLLLPCSVWPFRLRGIDAEYASSQGYVAYVQLLCYSLWLAGLVFLAMCFVPRYGRKPKSAHR